MKKTRIHIIIVSIIMLALASTLHAEYSNSYTNQDGDTVTIYGGTSPSINVYDNETGADETKTF